MLFHLRTLVVSLLLTGRKQRFSQGGEKYCILLAQIHMANATLALRISLSFLYLHFFSSSSRSKNILSWNKFSAFHLLFLWMVWGKYLLFIILATSQIFFFLKALGILTWTGMLVHHCGWDSPFTSGDITCNSGSRALQFEAAGQYFCFYAHNSLSFRNHLCQPHPKSVPQLHWHTHKIYFKNTLFDCIVWKCCIFPRRSGKFQH